MAEGRVSTPFSARPPPKFSATTDFNLWIQRFQLYLEEAEIPADKRARELVSLLEDGPFRVVSQLGLVTSSDYEAVKKELQQQFSPAGDEAEWQLRLQTRRQKCGETLTEFAGELRMLADRAYPDWVPKQRLEMARNQFVQGVQSSSIQLVLMKEKPTSLEKALELAQMQETIEAAQKRLHATRTSTAVASLQELDAAEPADTTNALQRTTHSSSSDSQLQELSQQVKQLADTVARLTARDGRQFQRRGKGPGPVCWGCRKRGHVQRNCPQRESQWFRPRENQYSQSRRTGGFGNASVESALAVEGLIGKRVTTMLVDTGSAVTILREDTWKEAGSPSITKLCRPVVAANGEKLNLLGRSEVTVTLGGFSAVHGVLVARELTQECLLGADFLVEHGCVVNMQSMALSLEGEEVPLRLQQKVRSITCSVLIAETTEIPARHQLQVRVRLSTPGDVEGERTGMLAPAPSFLDNHDVLVAHSLSTLDRTKQSLACILNPSSHPITLVRGEKLGELQILDQVEVQALQSQATDGPPAHRRPTRSEVATALQQIESGIEGLTGSQQRQLHSLLEEHIEVISVRPGDLGRTSLVKHRINTGDATPVRQPLRRLPHQRRSEVDKLLDDMLRQDIIEPAHGPWSSPIVLVTKKDGTLRFCVDFRRLNDLTTKDAHPLPRIDDTLDALTGARWFSTLDLASGYWQVELDPADREKTAFSTPRGLYQFRVMPFGLCNAPSTFQRLMELALTDLHWTICLVYLDDIIIFSRTVEEHLQRLKEVLQRLKAAGLKLKPAKCHLLQKSVKYLGHIVSEQGVETDPDKTSAVTKWTPPSTPKELRQFLGFASYYRRFVRDFAQTAAPLYALTEKSKAWDWTEQCETAFRALKGKLVSTPVLAFPHFDKKFILDCDASADGLGAVLSQLINGIERPIAYASRRLSRPERRYCATRREMLALVWAARHFRPYLYGRQFLARTDHNALKWLRNFKEPEGQVARWLEILSEFNFTVHHRPGLKHTNADALSRGLCRQCGLTDQEAELPSSNTTEGPAEESQTLVIATTEASSNWMPTVEIQQFQKADPDIHQMIVWMTTESTPNQYPRHASHRLQTLWSQRQQLILQDHVLYRRWEDIPHGGAHKHLQIVLPQTLVNTVLQELHNSITGGHLGVEKTLEKVRERFYWTGQRRDVQDWCLSCPLCASRKAPPKRPRAPLQIQETGKPLQRVAMDILGPLPETNSGHKYILVISDYFTKWTEAYPMRDMEAATVARLLVEEFICRFGAPQYLHTDQGRNFESRLIKEACKLLGVKKTRTTPYHPQSDGMVERFNRTLLTMLSLAASENENSWDTHLPMLMMAYRSSHHKTTSATPFSLMFGREVRLPVDLMFGSPEPEAPSNPSEYALRLRQRMETAFQQVRRYTQMQQNRQKELYDQRAGDQTYSNNDLVWLHCPAVPRGRSRKLYRPWQGPFRIIKALSSVHYRVSKVSSPRQRLVVHFDRLKPYHGNSPDSSCTDRPLALPSTGPSILQIPASRLQGGQGEDTTATEESQQQLEVSMPASRLQGGQDEDTAATEEPQQQLEVSREGETEPNGEQQMSPTLPRRSTRIRRPRDFGPYVTTSSCEVATHFEGGSSVVLCTSPAISPATSPAT